MRVIWKSVLKALRVVVCLARVLYEALKVCPVKGKQETYVRRKGWGVCRRFSRSRPR